jgi:ABC-type oligopeptide transport system ATPase subunit
MTTPLLSIDNVSKVFGAGGDEVTAVNHVSHDITAVTPVLTTIAGESGCGKSTLAMMILGFLQPTTGTIRFKGQDIYALDRKGFTAFRREVQAVFQNPFETFNPFYQVDRLLHLTARKFKLSRNDHDATRLIEQALRLVDLDPSYVLGRYPHELSGGQLQRISIARCFLVKPRLLIADEPVSMIDASLRVRVLRHLVRLKEEAGTTIVYITHDLSTALQISDEVLIAYKGSVVERGSAAEVIQTPSHEYTRKLVAAIPIPDPDIRWERSSTGMWGETAG